MNEEKFIVILGSARKNSDTKKVIDRLFRDYNYKLIDLLDYKISHYKYEADYPSDDDFLKIIEQLIQFDKIVFATPVYWYAMSGLMKIFFDRFTDIVTVNKQYGRKLKGKKIFLIAVGAEAELPEGFEVPFKRTADYFGMEFICTQYIKPDDLDSGSEVLFQF